MSCIFCDIAAGKAPASQVYEDERCLAFMDIHPLGKGHVLVVPREHAAQITDISPALSLHLFEVAQIILKAQRTLGLGVKGSHILLNDGKAANQQVPHIHVHVIPRHRGDTLRAAGMLARHVTGLFGRAQARATLDDQARQLRQALAEQRADADGRAYP